MAFMCCLAGISANDVETLEGVVQNLDIPTFPGIAALNVAKLGKLAPKLIVCDVDLLEVDGLEFLRQLRFVLPQCILAVFTRTPEQSWALSCHLAGASCVLSGASSPAELLAGLREALQLGCYTDPRFSRLSR